MKKVNKKGFVMVETLIVTVFVVTLFLFVYRISVPAMGEYEKMNEYDDIDSIYYANLYKQMLTRYGDMEYIENFLLTNSFLNITDCNNTNVYKNTEYCKLIQAKINITSNDYVFITDYDVKNFKNTIISNLRNPITVGTETLPIAYFDSGTLSNFVNYVNTVPNIESFYNKTSSKNYFGKYRLFIVRTMKEADLSQAHRYVNIGIYTGVYRKFIRGEIVYFDPGDGEKKFYVLNNSASSLDKVDIILAENLTNSYTCFNSTKTTAIPDTLLSVLKNKTSPWINVDYIVGHTYKSNAGYSIAYNGYRARLVEERDLLGVLGCKEDSENCFNPDEAFQVNYSQTELAFLGDNLTDTNGYWTSIGIPNSNLYAWSIQKGKIVPTNLNDCTNIGVRPVISVSKDRVRREGD